MKRFITSALALATLFVAAPVAQAHEDHGNRPTCHDVAPTTVDQARVNVACEKTAEKARTKSLRYSVSVASCAAVEGSPNVVRCNTRATVRPWLKSNYTRKYRAVVEVTGDTIQTLAARITSWKLTSKRLTAAAAHRYHASWYAEQQVYDRYNKLCGTVAWGWTYCSNRLISLTSDKYGDHSWQVRYVWNEAKMWYLYGCGVLVQVYDHAPMSYSYIKGPSCAL